MRALARSQKRPSQFETKKCRVYSSSWFSKIGAFCADETGQGTVEYILLLSFAVVGAMMFVRATLRVLDRGIGFLGGHLEKDLKTGKVSVSAWSN